MTYPVKVHLGHWDHPLDALHYAAISIQCACHEMRRKGYLTHQLPLSKVDLSILVLVRFVDQFEKV